jgi:hypothetical protein
MRGIARKHGLSDDSVSRHAKSHLPKTLAVAATARAEAQAGSLLERVRAAEEHARRLAFRAEADGDVRGAVAGLRVLLDALELLGKVAAEAESNLVESPEWLALRSRIADALEPFPEALAAVRAAVREVEAGDLRETVVVTLKLPDGPERRLFPSSAEE